MARAAFKCTKCTRKFSMKAHLARHMNTIHASPARRKAAAKKRRRKGGAKRRKVARAPRRAAMRAGAVGAGGARLLSDMRAYYGELTTQRSSLDAEIGAIETAMSAMGGTAPKRSTRPKARGGTRGPGRPPRAPRAGRAGSLKEAIVNVLSQRRTPLSPRDLAGAVVRAGYKTKAKDLTKAISNVLPELKMVKKVGRGMYTV
jgi:hypothetical protein